MVEGIKSKQLFLLVVAVIVQCSVEQKEYGVNIDLDKILSTTEEEYLSYCLDPYLKHDLPTPWGTLNFSHPRVHTLARGLAPALLRFGGTNADYAMFFNSTTAEERNATWSIVTALEKSSKYIVPIFPEDIDHLYGLARSSSGRLLYDLNLLLRYGEQWDPTNALLLMQYTEQQGYAKNMAFEMGNEPNYFKLKLNGKRIGQDFLILKKLLESFPTLKHAPLVGPDIHNIPSISAGFASTVRDQIDAFTLHSYYFNGRGAHASDYLKVKHFDQLVKEVSSWRDLMWSHAGAQVPLWIGETSDSNNEGTPNVTNRYISGFLWLDKLGIAARNGYKLVARQDFFGGNYPLISDRLTPNPDYWLSYVFKQLVGTRVLNVTVFGQDTGGLLFRVYGHCTSTKAGYPKGSITLFMVNLNAASICFSLNCTLCGKTADLYLLTPESGNLLSETVLLNGVPLKMVSDETLPIIKGKPTSLNKPVEIPGLSFGFVVLNQVKSKICVT